jgi:hypothetical protein
MLYAAATAIVFVALGFALPGILMTVALGIGMLISLPRALYETIKGK